MDSRILSPLVAMVLLLVPALPAVGADEEFVLRARYVLAIGLPEPADFGPRCTPIPSLHLTGGQLLLGPFGEKDIPDTYTPAATAWGACFEVPAGTRVVTVLDDLGGATQYRWTVSDDEDPACYAKGEATGVATVTVPDGCRKLRVLPFAGSLAGTIEVR